MSTQITENTSPNSARSSQLGFVVRLFALGMVGMVPTVALAEDAVKKTAPSSGEVAGEGGEPLWEAELRLGYGVMSRGTEMGSATGVSPLSIEATGAVAVNEEPHVMAFAGVMGEAMGRSGVGVTAGARVKVPELPLRVGGGGVWRFAPTTLWGAKASAGSCFGKGAFALCADVQMTAYFAGTGLPNDETELQMQFVLGLVARGARR